MLIDDAADRALLRAWKLSLEDPSDAVYEAIELLLPTLASAGYADVKDDRWGFSPKGVARVEELERVADS